jgi:L-iditol 2-dehydrogenase
MKAIVVERPGEVAWREVGEPPEPGPYEALTRVRSFTLCTSPDKHLRDCVWAATPENCPFLLGHESVGEVVGLGPNCRHLNQGDLVLRPMLSLPGYASFWGGFAEYGIVTDLRAHREDGSPEIDGRLHKGHQVVPASVAPTEAAMLITLKEVLSYLGNIQARQGGRLLVLGHGPVGLSAAYLGGMLIGCERIVAAGRRPEAQAQVLDFGVDAYLDTRDERWPEEAVRLLGGPADSIYDTTGNAAVVRAALAALAPDGSLGTYAARPRTATDPLPEDERVVGGATDEGLSHERIVAAVLDGTLKPGRFVTHVLEPERIAEGFKLVEERAAIKVAFELN